MPPKGKKLTIIDLMVIDTLRSLAKRRCLGTRALSRESGIGLNRTGIILRGDGPAPTVGELDQLAGALGTTASDIMRTAEREARRARIAALGERFEVHDGDEPLPDDIAAQGKGANVEAEQEGSQDQS